MIPGQAEGGFGLVFLPWDSAHFGFQIGKAQWSKDVRALLSLITQAIRQGLTLVYLFTPPDEILPDFVYNYCVDVFCSRRADFAKKLTHAGRSPALGSNLVELTLSNCDLDQVRQLGLMAGKYSRFIRDGHFPRDRAEEMFRLWAQNSVRGVLADVVVGAFSCKGELIGLITAKEEASVARIGLVAVAPAFRGQGIGKELLSAIEGWCAARGITNVKVTTQSENLEACALYQKCGYSLVEEQNVFHLWLHNH